MVVQWVAVLLAWLAGVGVQLSQASAVDSRGAMLAVFGAPVVALLAWWWAPPSWRSGWRPGLTGCAVAFAVGWGWTQWQAVDRLWQRWPDAWSDQAVILTGRVVALPQNQPWGQRFEVEVIAIEHAGRQWHGGQRWQLPGVAAPATCPQRISLSWPEPPVKRRGGGATPPPRVVPGEVWRWTARLSAPQGMSNPGGFDAEQWMFAHDLRAQGKVVSPIDGRPALLLRPVQWWSAGWLERWRMRLRDHALEQVRDRQVAGLVVGLTIGEQSAITPKDWEVLRDTGTAHLAAISGTHVTMMGWLVSLVVGRWWRRSWARMHWVPAPVASRVAALLGALLYAFVSGWGVPAQRTVVMLAVVTALRLSSRRWPWPLILLLAGMVVTVLDPWALLQAGFWLSFAAVGLLMLSGGDARVGADLPWHRRLLMAARGLWRSQWVAFVGLAPLSLVFFQQVSLVGLLANAVCIPLFTLVITPLAMFGLACEPVWQVLTPLVHVTMGGLAWLAEWQWAFVSGAAVHGWAAALGLAAGAWMLAPLPWRWRLMGLPAMLPLVWPTSWSQPLPRPPDGHMSVLAVDIGQGTAVLVRTARHTLLFDAGPKTSPESDAGQRILVGLLRWVGVGQLDVLMVSHGDADHVGGAASVVKAVGVLALHSSLRPQHELLQVPDVRGKRPPHTDCAAGQGWEWDGVRFDVLQPSRADWAVRETLSDNDMSCVLRVQAQGARRSLLLTGDVEKRQEAALVSRLGAELSSEVLMVPHHGSRTSSTTPFLDAVRPRVAVIQAGARNRYGHPHATVVSRYEAQQVAVVQTSQCGAWHWRTDRGGPEDAAVCWRDARPRYWQSRSAEP